MELMPYFWPKKLDDQPFGAAHTSLAHIREYTPPGFGMAFIGVNR